MYQLADRLNKTLTEIDDMPATEFAGWIAYVRQSEKMKEER